MRVAGSLSPPRARRCRGWDAARRAEQTAQVGICRDLFSPFRPAQVEAAWLAAQDGLIPQPAQAVYEERDPGSGVLDDLRPWAEPRAVNTPGNSSWTVPGFPGNHRCARLGGRQREHRDYVPADGRNATPASAGRLWPPWGRCSPRLRGAVAAVSGFRLP
jgi:hypothetical protein